MKKYKLLKDLPWCNVGTILKEWKPSYNNIINIINNDKLFEIYKDWFEEIKEETIKPKYKVWDYVVYKDLKWTSYIKIFAIHYRNWFIYNGKFSENELRLPTQNELQTFFR